MAALLTDIITSAKGRQRPFALRLTEFFQHYLIGLLHNGLDRGPGVLPFTGSLRPHKNRLFNAGAETFDKSKKFIHLTQNP